MNGWILNGDPSIGMDLSTAPSVSIEFQIDSNRNRCHFNCFCWILTGCWADAEGGEGGGGGRRFFLFLVDLFESLATLSLLCPPQKKEN